MAKSHAIIAGVNSGKTNYLIRKAVVYALSGRSVLYVDPEHAHASITKKFFAYRDNDVLLSRNIDILTVPVRDTTKLTKHLNNHKHYDVIIMDLPIMMVKNPSELNSFISELSNKYDVLFSVQANRTFYDDCESGVKSKYITDNINCVDSVSVILKTQEPANSEMVIYTEYQYNQLTGVLSTQPSSCYYLESTLHNQVKLMPFGEDTVNIFDIEPSLLMGILNTKNP